MHDPNTLFCTQFLDHLIAWFNRMFACTCLISYKLGTDCVTPYTTSMQVYKMISTSFIHSLSFLIPTLFEQEFDKQKRLAYSKAFCSP